MPNTFERDKNSEFAWDIYNDLAKLGWMHAPLPEAQGGLGMSVADFIWVIKEVAYGSAGVATTVMANLLGTSPVVLYGSDELKNTVFQEKFINNRVSLWSFAMSESAVGFNVIKTKTTAKKVDGGYLVTGAKDYITNASYAEHICVFANVQDSNGKYLGITCFYTPGNAPGIVRDKPMKKLGHRESNTCSLFFNDVFIPEKHRLGQVGDGLKILHHSLGRSKALIGAISAGLCQRAFDLSSDYLKLRQASDGKSLLDKPTLQHAFARYHTEMEASWLLTCLAAQNWDQGNLGIRESSMAKMFGADLAVRFATEALEFMGGSGYSEDYEVARLFRDAKLLEIYEGSTLILEALISKEIFKPTPKKANLEKTVAA